MSEPQAYDFPVVISQGDKDYLFRFRLASIYDDIQIGRRADRLYGTPITPEVRETAAASDAFAVAELETLVIDKPDGWQWDSPRYKALIVMLYAAYLEKRLDFRNQLEENTI